MEWPLSVSFNFGGNPTNNSDQNGDMFYSVLWLPPRYKVLYLYLLLVPVVIGLIAIDKGPCSTKNFFQIFQIFF